MDDGIGKFLAYLMMEISGYGHQIQLIQDNSTQKYRVSIKCANTLQQCLLMTTTCGCDGDYLLLLIAERK